MDGFSRWSLFGEEIFLKARGPFAGQLAAEGATQFTYMRAGKPARIGYWTLPSPALDDPEIACEWARRALAAANPDFS